MLRWILLCYLFAVAAPAPARATTPSFRLDVQSVFAKAGCNAGTCHGNANGKGGFKLSLRGDDPDSDLVTITRGDGGRRLNLIDPARSLLLLKPTGQLAHEGGKRFGLNSYEYRALLGWIAGGGRPDSSTLPRVTRLVVTPAERALVAPADRVQLRVEALFSNGTRREVTRMAVYEPTSEIATVSHDGLVQRVQSGQVTVNVRYLTAQAPVRLSFVPARPAFVPSFPPEGNYLDREVFARLRVLRMNPSELCTDSEFMRRAYLDLLGVLPTPEEAKKLVSPPPDSPAPSAVTAARRARLVDYLLTRPEFAESWAQKWSDLLRNEEKALDRKGVEVYYTWMRDAIASGKPMDEFARDLIAAKGSTYTHPPANYYRSLRTPVTRGEATAQVFLGVRLQCAQCHNHPFDRWTQDDYYDWLQLFARVDYKIIENNKRDRLDTHEFIGEQIVEHTGNASVRHPRSGLNARPRFLGERLPLKSDDDYLVALARWTTSPQNPLFARVIVNRVWYHLMGRGLVDPIDDFRSTNPPSHPALLDALAADFVAHGFDLRHLIRTIMNSRAYQLSSTPNPTNLDDEVNYARVATRRLTAEQLLDALHQVTAVPTHFNGYPIGLRAGQLPGVEAVRTREQPASPGDQFLTLFGKPRRLLSCECERVNEPTMNQALFLVSGPALHTLLGDPANRLTALLRSSRSHTELVTELYWTALTRPPTEKELSAALRLLDGASNRRAALEDLTWALVNAKEFLLRK